MDGIGRVATGTKIEGDSWKQSRSDNPVINNISKSIMLLLDSGYLLRKFRNDDEEKFVIHANASMDVGVTIPWMKSVESRLVRRPRATHGDNVKAGIQ